MTKFQSVSLQTLTQPWTGFTSNRSPATDARSWYVAGPTRTLPGVDIDDFLEELCAEDPNFANGLAQARKDVAEEYLGDVQTLSALRLKAGLSQKELAMATSTSQPAIAKMEKGDTNPRLSTLVKLSKALNCKIDDIAQVMTANGSQEDE